MNPQNNNLNTSKPRASLNEQDQPSPDLSFPFKLVANHLSKVDKFINDQAKSFDPNVENYVSYVCEIGGKRIRPALAILAGGSLGEVNDDHIKIGAIIELVHLATLIHDDIMDEATIRREMPTASAKWGSTLSVLLGEYTFQTSSIILSRWWRTHIFLFYNTSFCYITRNVIIVSVIEMYISNYKFPWRNLLLLTIVFLTR